MTTCLFRFAICAAALLGLASCGDGGLPFPEGFKGGLQGTGRAPLTRIALSDNGVTVYAPPGYCIDRRSLRRSSEGDFAVLARCDTVGATGDYLAYDLAIVTITTRIAAEGAAAPTPTALAGLSPAHRMLSQINARGVAIVRLEGEDSEIGGVSTIHWRAAFNENGHIVGLALYAPEGSPLLGRAGQSMLRKLAERIRMET